MFKKKNIEKANDILKYAVRLCQGGCCKCPDGVRISLILSLNDDLLSMGALWQSKRLINHLHKAQQGFMRHPERDDGGV